MCGQQGSDIPGVSKYCYQKRNKNRPRENSDQGRNETYRNGYRFSIVSLASHLLPVSYQYRITLNPPVPSRFETDRETNETERCVALTVHSVFAHVEKLLHFRPESLLKPPLLTNNGESTVRPRRGEGNVALSPEPAVVATQGSAAALLPPRGGRLGHARLGSTSCATRLPSSALCLWPEVKRV